VVLALLAFWAAEEFIFWGPARQRWKRITQANHAAILEGCRQMMAAHQRRGIPAHTVSRHDPAGFGKVPPSILDLEPVDVLISADQIRICVFSLPRLYVIGFSTNATQYGAERLIDGLWLSREPEKESREKSP
jgi:hypothetical protein